MPSRLQLFQSSRSLAIRSRVSTVSSRQIPLCIRLVQRRSITANEKPLPESETLEGPNQSQLPHVSEEAAKQGEITGEGGPDLDQSTPVSEVLQRDKKAQDKAPEVVKDDLKSQAPKGARSYSTTTRRRMETQPINDPASTEILNSQTFKKSEDKSSKLQPPGQIFGLPELPLPPKSHLKRRYDPIIEQVTNLLMQDGKKSIAQRRMAMILERLGTASPPISDPRHPLIPGSPPTTHLPLNPTLYLTLAIDSVAPLIRIRSQRGAAGGGVALQIPIPLNLRQRRRTAVMWILDAASKRRSKGSGRTMFAHKVADELISIVEGKSGVWEKRGGVHRLGVGARANLSFGNRRR